MGRCTSALIPSTAHPGRYRVTLAESRGALHAEFEVAGKPLPASEYERAIGPILEPQELRRLAMGTR